MRKASPVFLGAVLLSLWMPAFAEEAAEPAKAVATKAATAASKKSGSASAKKSEAVTDAKPSKSVVLPQILQEVEEKYAKAATLQANFSQVNEVAALKTKKTSSGVLLVKRPNKLRWETLEPDMNILVSDGRKFWFYTPPFDETEHGQVIVKKSNEINSKLANALLSGHFSVARDMKFKAEGATKFVVVPKAGTAGTIRQAEIEIDPLQKLIHKVTLSHKGGNRSEISLSKIELGKTIGDEVFIFTPPPNTDKVE